MAYQHKDFFIKNFTCYLISCLLVFALNILYRSSDSSLFTWVLAPTARWAGILGGLSFEPLPEKGYVNEAFHFLIAPSCSGIRFLQILFLMLIFSHTHHMEAGWKKGFWVSFAFLFSYFATVAVNGIRIVLSIYLPVWLEHTPSVMRLLSPKTLHTLIGVAIYFSSLLILQPLADQASAKLFGAGCSRARQAFYSQRAGMQKSSPVFWYFLAVLGLPFVRRLASGNMDGFGKYALIIVLTCGAILLMKRFFTFLTICAKIYYSENR